MAVGLYLWVTTQRMDPVWFEHHNEAFPEPEFPDPGAADIADAAIRWVEGPFPVPPSREDLLPVIQGRTPVFGPIPRPPSLMLPRASRSAEVVNASSHGGDDAAQGLTHQTRERATSFVQDRQRGMGRGDGVDEKGTSPGPKVM